MTGVETAGFVVLLLGVLAGLAALGYTPRSRTTGSNEATFCLILAGLLVFWALVLFGVAAVLG